MSPIIIIIDCDSVAIPPGLDAESIWVLNGDEVWGNLHTNRNLLQARI